MRWFIILWSLVLVQCQTHSPSTPAPTSIPTNAPTRPTQSPTITPYVSQVTVAGGFRKDQVNINGYSIISLNSWSTQLPIFPFSSVIPECMGPQIASNCFVSTEQQQKTNETGRVHSLTDGKYLFHADVVAVDIPQQPTDEVTSFVMYGRQSTQSSISQYTPSIPIWSPTTSVYYLSRIVKTTTISPDTVCKAAQIASNNTFCPRTCLADIFENNDVWMTLSISACSASFNDTVFQTLLNLPTDGLTEGPALFPMLVPRNFGLQLVTSGNTYASWAVKRNITLRNYSTTTPYTVEVAYADLVGPSFKEALYFWGRLPDVTSGWKLQGTNSFRAFPSLGDDILSVIFNTDASPRQMSCMVNLTSSIADTNVTCIVGFIFYISVLCNSSSANSFCGASVQIFNTSFAAELISGHTQSLGQSSYSFPLAFFDLISIPGLPLFLNVTTSKVTHTIKLNTVWISNITFWDENNQSLPIDMGGEFVQFNAAKFGYTFPLSNNFTVRVTCNSPPCLYSILHVDEYLGNDNQLNLTSGTTTKPFAQSVSPLRISLDFAPQYVYVFSPYVRSFANIAFRVSQFNDTTTFSEYPPFFDTLVTSYANSVSQYFTFSVDIFHCSGANPPCAYTYIFNNNITGTGFSGTSSSILKLPAPADSSNNFTAPLIIQSGDGTGTYTFTLTLDPNCQDGYFFPSKVTPVRCPGLTEQSEACCKCPDHATCHDASMPPRPEAGYVRGSQVWDMVKCDPPQACLEGGTCADGYKNAAAACSQCQSDPPHFRVNRFCEECPKYTVFVAVLGFLLFLCALALFVKISKPDHTKKFTLSIALGYAQIISIFVTFPVPWPPISLALFNIFSFLNFNVDLFSPECAVQVDFFSKWLFKIFLPIITLGIFGIVYITVLYVPRARNWYVAFLLWDIEDVYDNVVRRSRFEKMTFDSEEKRQQHENALQILKQSESEWHQARIEWEETHLEDRFINALVTAATVGYTFIAKTASEPLNCVGQSGGAHMYIRADPAAYCYEGEWFTYRGLSIFFTLIYTAGIPVYFAYLLVQAKRHNRLQDQAFYYRYGHLVLPYRSQFWYWELVQLLRKLVTIQLIEFFYSLNGTSLAQVNSVLITLIVFLALQEFLKPYEFSWCNRVAFCWNIASVLVLCSALLFDLGLDSTSSSFYGVALFIICGFTVGISLYAFWLENKRSRARKALFNGTTMLTREKEEKDLLLTLFGARLGGSLHRKTRDLLVDDRTLLYAKLSAWASSSSTGAAIADASASTLEMMSFPDMPLVEAQVHTPSSQSLESEPKVPPPLPAKQLKARTPPPLPTARLYAPKPPSEPRTPIDDPPRRPARLSEYARDPHLADVRPPPIPPPRPPRRQFPGMKRLGSEGFTEMKQT